MFANENWPNLMFCNMDVCRQGHFPTWTIGHFTIWRFVKMDICQHRFANKDVYQHGHLPTGTFANLNNLTFGNIEICNVNMEICQLWWFTIKTFTKMDISQHGHLPTWMFAYIDICQQGHLATWTFTNMDICNLPIWNFVDVHFCWSRCLQI